MLQLKDSFLVLLWLVLTVVGAYGQKNEEVKPAIKAMAFAYSDSIAVRWAPTTPVAWQLTNKYGYYIERITITRNNKVITPEKIRLYNVPLKPWKQAAWEKLIDHNDYTAIAAQALFGSSFESTSNYSGDVLQVMSLVRELEQRFSFALLAADLSRITASALALGIVDKQVKKNEKYLYKIYPAIPSNTLKVDTGFVFIGVADKKELPKPLKLAATAGDKVVMLNWARNYYDDIYVAYRVEKSEDGKNFKSITNLPILNAEPAKGLPADKLYKLDSLGENNKKLFYRIVGLTPFGEEGPPSDVINTMGVKPFEVAPAITRTRIEDNERVLVQWNFPEALAGELQGFNILRSSEADAQFSRVNAELIAGSVREFMDQQPRATNYYKVEAIGKHGQRSTSFANMVQLEDSIPPVAPKGLKAAVTEKGLVTLSWQANQEKDLVGYRLFRANYRGEEFSQITVSPRMENLYVDTIPLQTLTDKVFYKVVAVDSRFNTSAFSEVLSVNRPDIVPPAPPAFTKFNATEKGVELAWSLSPSEDVVKHELWRRDLSAKMNVLLKELPGDSVRQYLDATITPGILYEYTLCAYDETGLKTCSPQPLRIKPPLSTLKPAPEKVIASADRTNKLIQLNWQYTFSDVDKILIYRARAEEPITLFTSAPDSRAFQDKEVEANATYRYRVQAVFKNGMTSKLSEEVVIKY
jgi:fibronectin type 3 domain-containing protein